MGQRTCIPSNDDSKYTVFKRSNKDGKVSALVIMNFQNSTETISVNLKNTGILLGQTPLNLLMEIIYHLYCLRTIILHCLLMGI